ncbi:MAG: MFS transporter, partial [Rhodospirillales bacterium]|nr:MFS transporter [Rhodospirillales bacterium]
ILLGVALTSLQVGGMIAGPVAGTLSDRTGRRPVVLAGLAATTLVIAVVPAITVPTPFVVLLVFLGFTLFAVRPVVHSWSMDLVP